MNSNHDTERTQPAHSRPVACHHEQRDTLGRRRFFTLAGGALATTVLAACGGARATVTPRPTSTSAAATTPTTGPMLVIQAVEYALRTNGSLPAGVTTIQLRNMGNEHHETQFIRLNSGVTPAQFMAAAKQSEDMAVELGTPEGGPGRIKPNNTSTVMLTLMPGQYVIACFVAASDGMSHASKGMVLPVMVTASTSPPGALPMGQGTITLGSTAFTVPAMLPKGRTMFRIANAGNEAHEFFVGRLGAGKTAADLQTALANPSDSDLPDWFEPSGGMEGMKAGGMGVVVLELQPGSYAAVDGPSGDEPPIVKGFTVAG